MKIFWEGLGEFQKIASDNNSLKPTTLEELFTDIQAIATYEKIYYLADIQKSCGLDILPHQVIAQVVKNIDQRTQQSLMLTDTIIHPIKKIDSQIESRKFIYQFTTIDLEENFTIPLDADDSQLPRNFEEFHRGTYCVELQSNMLAFQSIYEQAKKEIKEKIKNEHLDVLYCANKNKESDTFSVPLSNQCRAWLAVQELSQNYQKYVFLLRKSTDTLVQDPIIDAYYQKFPQEKYSYVNYNTLPEFTITSTQSESEFYITNGSHRKKIQQIIEEAEEFLLLCSFRIEDVEIVEEIAKKAKTLPFGIWILTSFDEIQDKIDQDMDGKRNDNLAYKYSDQSKRKCWDLLSRSGIGFRSGKLHIKTYISEKSAYLGSCNLTGGSLGRNLEAGMIWSNTSQHKFLIQYFRELWRHKTTDKIIPTETGTRSENLPKETKFNQLSISHFALSSYQYEQDLTRELKSFINNPQGEVLILTRNFNPNSEQLNCLIEIRKKRKHAISIFYENQNRTSLKSGIFQRNYLHCKVVIIGQKVAYVGSQDFDFRAFSLENFTYKTTNPKEITEIHQKVRSTLNIL